MSYIILKILPQIKILKKNYLKKKNIKIIYKKFYLII